MRNIILATLLLITMGCKSQINNNLNKKKMKYFDNQHYNNLEEDNSYIINIPTEKRFKKGDKRIKITENNKIIQVEITSIRNPYCEVYTYDSIRKVILSQGKTFYSMEIGIWEYYDIDGKLIKKINTDEGFSFSLNELIKKMKSEYGVDLLDIKQKINISKGVCGQNKCYQIIILLSSEYEREIYKIEGNSGKTLSSPKMEKEEIIKNMGVKSSTPYRTYNGKNYTKEEWKK